MTRLISRITLFAILFVGPFTWFSNLYHGVLHFANAPLDIAEEYVAKPIIAADYYVDEANGESPEAKAAQQKRAAKKAAKKVAKQAKAASHK